MVESNDDQTLEKIHEVDESQIKIILTSQCTKVDKLKMQSEQQKQVCNFTSDGNLKLKTEIKIAEQEVQRIQERNCKVEELLNDIKNITKEDNTVSNKTATSAPTGMEDIEDSWPNLTTGIDNAMALPKLQLNIHEDLDIFSIKLNELKKVGSQRAFKRESEELALDLIPTKKMRPDETVKDVRVSSSTPKKSANDTGTNEYHRKSLMIHILDNIKLLELDSAETNNIVSNIKPSSSKDVDVIDSDVECDQEKVIDKTQKDILVSGFLFTHGPQGIIDSFNISTSTDNSRSGFDDTDADYPYCIDSSLPSSPKADIELPNTNDNNNQQEISQDAPNLMSGLREEWLSLFEKISSEMRSDTSEQNQNSN